MKNLAESPEYKTFIHKRDRALEDLLSNAKIRNTNTMNKFLTRVLTVFLSDYVIKVNSGTVNKLITNIQTQLEPLLEEVTNELTQNILDLRKNTYVLTVASEGEAIARATGKRIKVKTDKQDLIGAMLSKNQRDENMRSRVRLSLDRLIRKLLDKYQLSVITNSSVEEFIDRMFSVIPKRKNLPNKHTLKKLTEAQSPTDKEDEIALLQGEISDSQWNDLVNEYKKNEVVTTRSPESYFDREVGRGELEEVFEWELENELTDDFVRSVREGQIEVASENGIKDFVWVAVIDNRTGESDKWRDGKTLSEIERHIQQHGEDPFGNNLLSPPIHPNCRCTIVPLFPGLPEPRRLPKGEFEKWLEG